MVCVWGMANGFIGLQCKVKWVQGGRGATGDKLDSFVLGVTFSGHNSGQLFLLFGLSLLQKQVIYFKTCKGLEKKKSNISMLNQSNLFKCVKECKQLELTLPLHITPLLYMMKK